MNPTVVFSSVLRIVILYSRCFVYNNNIVIIIVAFFNDRFENSRVWSRILMRISRLSVAAVVHLELAKVDPPSSYTGTHFYAHLSRDDGEEIFACVCCERDAYRRFGLVLAQPPSARARWRHAMTSRLIFTRYFFSLSLSPNRIF